jgi:hypothetical protein
MSAPDIYGGVLVSVMLNPPGFEDPGRILQPVDISDWSDFPEHLTYLSFFNVKEMPKHYDDLPEEVRIKLALLFTMGYKPTVKIAGVGCRLGPKNFWVRLDKRN